MIVQNMMKIKSTVLITKRTSLECSHIIVDRDEKVQLINSKNV